MITFDTSLLLGYYQSRTSLAAAGTRSATSTGAGTLGSDGRVKYAPTAPWATDSDALRSSDLVKSAMAGRRFVNENAAQLDLQGASADYKKLFSLYQGLNTLVGLAEQAAKKGLVSSELSRLQKTFDRGLDEVGGYADSMKLEQLRVTRGDATTTAKTAVGVPKATYDYTTPTLYTGKSTDEVPAFAGPAQFNLSVKKLAGTMNISVDLAELGSTPRTMGNVVNLINSKLQAAGVLTRFSVERTPAPPRTVEVGGKTVTLPAAGDAFAMKIKGDSAEKLTFSAVARPAVYVTTYAGDPDPDKNTKTEDAVYQNALVKIDPTGATAPETRIRTATLSGTVGAVHASQVGPDGSLYMLADIDTSVEGQAIKGEQDTALLKYDSAGKLLYARTLGAVEKASGATLAVSADGKVAIAGAVTGELGGATNGPLNSSATSGKSDSFVTLFNAKGDEVWTVRRGALEDDQATAVAFSDDGSVYVAGKTKSSLPGGVSVGGWDSYLTAYSTSDKGVPKTLFTQQFGTAGTDAPAGIVVDGNKVTVAGAEDGKAVLRSFDVTTTETRTTKTWQSDVLTVTTENWTAGALTNSAAVTYPTPGALDATTTSTYVSSATVAASGTRDLGDLGGGSIAGLKLDGGQLYIAGQTRNAALNVGGLTSASAGGQDAFAARISTDLSSTAQDTLAYYGGAGDNTVSGMTVANGHVYLVGSAGEDLPGLPAVGKKDGYFAELDMGTGAVVSSQRLSGKDGIATASTVAVNLAGASDLDKFGLPSGLIDYTRSPLITSATAARDGDQFQIRTRAGGHPSTITITATDTLETLAAKIRRATGSAAKVEVVSSGANRILKISPRNDNATIEIMPGKASTGLNALGQVESAKGVRNGKDALDALGLAEGVVRNTEFVDGKTVSTAPGGNIYGLGLKMDLSLSNPDEVKRATAVLTAALGKIRTAYRDLEAAAKPQTPQSNLQTGGPVPAYLQAQIANYTAGLNRLTGG